MKLNFCHEVNLIQVYYPFPFEDGQCREAIELNHATCLACISTTDELFFKVTEFSIYHGSESITGLTNLESSTTQPVSFTAHSSFTRMNVKVMVQYQVSAIENVLIRKD